jgi:peptide/nickel transport system substrate-binding protein
LRRVHRATAVSAAAALLLCAACLRRPLDNPDVIVVGMTSGPNNLDPRLGTDDVSQKIHQLVFESLLALDDHLRVTPWLAERLEQPDPTTYIVRLRRGIRFHDGHELTSEDVVHTFRSVLDSSFGSPRRGGFRGLTTVNAVDGYTVAFRLAEPFPSFLFNLSALQIVPAGADAELHDRPIGTGPYRFVRYAVDDYVALEAFEGYHGGAPRNSGLLLKVVPDEVMRGLELRKGTMDVVVNDVSPDIYFQLAGHPQLQTATAPGVDYQYIGLNLQDRALQDRRVRQAIGYAIDRRAIVEHLRRGLASVAPGLLPSLSWAFAPDVFQFAHDPARARALLDDAGFPDPDGDGPAPRLTLTLKVSNVEFNRLQSTVIQQDLQRVGIALDVRAFEFATLYADVLAGNFQMFTLQWTAGALADPDILRRVFHTSQAPPAGFNRGRYSNPRVDALLDEAAATFDEARRRVLYVDAQRILAEDAPYISLWHKTNFAIAQRSLSGVRLNPLADLFFLKDVARVRQASAD